MELKNLKKITSEEEYWQQHKIYSRKLSHLTRKVKLYFSNPKEYIAQFETLIKEMLYIQLINEEQANQYRTKLYNEMQNPKVKQKIKEKLEKIKSKFRK